MTIIASATIDLQRLTRRERPLHPSLALALARAGAPLALATLAFAALHNGHVICAGALLLVGLLAGLLALLASKASLAKVGWLALREHCLVLARRAAAGRACARLRAQARAHDYIFSIFSRRLELIDAAAHVLIGNRVLPTHCISARVCAQRPN